MRSDDGALHDNHPALHAHFRWHVPPLFNIGHACCTRWARSGRVAVRWEADGAGAASDGGGAGAPAGDRRSGVLGFRDLHLQAMRLSGALQRLGVRRGDRVAVILPQRPQAAVAHIAIYRMGAVAMPLSMLFGPEALAYRLQDSGAVAAIVDGSTAAGLDAVRGDCPDLRSVVVVGGVARGFSAGPGSVDWDTALQSAPAFFTAVRTRAEDPAVLIYTSGTTGAPKGALLPHRALIGNLTGFVCSQNWFDGEPVFWSPADWAWTGGLMDALLPTLYFGREIVAFNGRFSPEVAFDLLQRHRVTHSFLFPTALKAMMKAVPAPRERYRLHLPGLMSAGEAVGDAVFGWCRDALGVPVNEMFGQTEINYVVGNCRRTVDVDGSERPGWPARPGSMGRAYPGHRVAVIDDDGHVCAPGTPGDVAVHRRDVHGQPDPVFFLGYWNNPAATAAKFTGDPNDSWCRTGDSAVMDADGTLWYQGRSDDVFKVAGYRIGPSEIENCLVKHPAVANAAVVPKPDADRGAVVKAYVVLAAGHAGDAALVQALQQHVRSQLAPYEYPKEIEFIDSLPMTTTGKVQRRLLRLQEEQRAAALGRGPATCDNLPGAAAPNAAGPPAPVAGASAPSAVGAPPPSATHTTRK